MSDGLWDSGPQRPPFGHSSKPAATGEPTEASDPSWTKWDLAKVAFPPTQPASQPTVTRYDLRFGIDPFESPDGRWVKYEDVLALLRAAEQK